MSKYGLPIDMDTVNMTEEIPIDMSKLEFDVPTDKQKRSSFIFLRNAGIKADLCFDSCSYEDKEEFLLQYLLEDIDVNADILSSTWIEILSARDGGGVVLPSILSSDEIQLFLGEHTDLISEIYQLINSLPIHALYCSNDNGKLYDTNDFKKTDWNRVKITNFWKLAKYDAFILLADNNTEPLFYEKIFVEGEYYISKMMELLPYFNLLSAFTLSPEIQDDTISKINDLLVLPVVDQLKRKEEITE